MTKLKDQSEVAYIYSSTSTGWFDKLPSNINRSSIVHELIQALELHQMLDIFEPKPIARKFLEEYHSIDYLDLIFDNKAADVDTLDSFGLVDDCSIFDGLGMYSLYLGGTVEATLKALEEGYRYVINWDGGRHHAQGSSASGFCFINDVVLLILKMKEDYDKILYIDLDVHHGDGVENAFLFSDKVFTFSIHKFCPGFFPGSGRHDDQGKGNGLGFCLNIPINHNISGEGFYELFQYSFSHILSIFDPDAIVCVCGADVLTTDPHRAFNVGSYYYSKCISDILETKIPTVFLGGGGYNHYSTAKLWSNLTHTIISGSREIQPLPELIPEHKFWPYYVNDENLIVEESLDWDKSKESKVISEIKDFIHNRK